MLHHKQPRGSGPEDAALPPAGAPDAREVTEADRHITRLDRQHDDPARQDEHLTPSGQRFQRTRRADPDPGTWDEAAREAGQVAAGAVLKIGIAVMLLLCGVALTDDPHGSVNFWDVILVLGCIALLWVWWRFEDTPAPPAEADDDRDSR